MRLLLIVFCIAAAQAGTINRHRPRQAEYESYGIGNLPSNENSQINHQNFAFPLAQVGFSSRSGNFQQSFENVPLQQTNFQQNFENPSSKSLDFQQNFVQSTPKPDFESNQYFVSSTVAPDAFVNQQFVSSTPDSIGQNVQEFQSQGPVTNFGQTRLSVLNSPLQQTNFQQHFENPSSIDLSSKSLDFQQNFVQSTPKPDFKSNQYFISSTVAPDAFANQQFISSTPNSIDQNEQEIQFQGPVTNFGQTRFSVLNSEQPSLNTADFGSSQFSLESNFGDQNPVTVKAVTSGGSIDESFGVSGDIQNDENEEVEVSKNFYFFAAPEEQETIQARVNFVQPAKKNVNVVFIKAPAPPKLHPIQITPPEVKQEKTVVYVLVKKPELHQQIIVKAAPVSTPKKPEVYFLKYKNEAEAHEVVSKVKGEHGSGEASIDIRTGTSGEYAQNILSNSDSSSIGGINTFTEPALPFGVQINEIPHGLRNEIVHIGGNHQLISGNHQLIGGNQLTIGGAPETFSVSTEAPFLSELNYKSSTVSPNFVSSTPFASRGQFYVSTTVSPNLDGELSYEGSSSSPIRLSEEAEKYLPPN